MESFSNILFSSVVGGPSFVHSPHVPSPAKVNSCSYYLSILDPNIDLPELSSKDIEDLLCESNITKSSKDVNIVHFEKSEPIFSKNGSLIIDSKNSSISSPNYPIISPNSIKPINKIDTDAFKSPSDGILFKCIVRSCNDNFPNKTAQMSHFFAQHKDKVITCISCKAIFKSRYSLNNHCLINPHCKLKNVHRCKVDCCDKYFFNVQNLENHLSTQHNLPSISCLSPKCDLKFFDADSRDYHVKRCHGDMTHKCSRCDQVFLNRVSFDKHESKHHRDSSSSRHSSCSLYACPEQGCDKCFSNMSNIRRHRQQFHNNNNNIGNRDNMLINDKIDRVQPLTESVEIRNDDIKIMYACPLPECNEALNDKAAFQSHFLKHFTGELPGDINSLLPPDPPVPGLELHSKTFEANVDYIYQREETNLVQALDLVPDKLLESLEWLDENISNLSPNSCLTSALILPSTEAVSNRNLSARNNRRRKNPYQNESSSTCNINEHGSINNMSERFSNEHNIGSRSKYKCCNENTNLSLTNSLFTSTGNCARTCPKINSVMINLIKRRRVFLKERVGMMQSCDSVLYQPAARQPALKQVVHRIFNSQQLPNKYEEIVYVDTSEL